MALVVRSVVESYNYYFRESIDPRTADWFLLQNPPVTIACILIGYVLMIRKGPQLMEDRKAFDLKYVMMAYNLFQVVANLILGLYAGYNLFVKRPFDFKCQSINFSSDEIGMIEVTSVYLYFLLKILDLFDTLFIVLKKKNSHLSFLHCYHHFFMAMGTYIAARWVPGGHALLLGFINLFVHAFMYFYYFLTAIKPELKRSIWWKKHITQVQLIQFAILMVGFGRACFADTCDFPKFWLWMLVIQNSFMFALFSDFYRKTYLRKNNSTKNK